MLKRQRPVTPPPSSLDFPTYLPDILAKGPLSSPDLTSISESCGKRRRLERPDRETLRGWTLPSSDVSHGEHGDGKEDVERSSHGDGAEGLYDGIPNQSILSPGDGGYKQTNNILHEVHVLNQHRLVFSPSERPPQSYAPEISPHSVHIHPNSQEATESSYGLPSSAYRKSPVESNSSQLVHHIPAGQLCSAKVADDHADLQEAQAVWERYGGTNKLLGSLFLSRRRELQVAFYTPDS